MVALCGSECKQLFLFAQAPIVSLFFAADSYGLLQFALCLRPLSLIPRWKALHIVFISFGKQFSTIIDVIWVALAFWLLFAIMGVQLFAGKFYKVIFV